MMELEGMLHTCPSQRRVCMISVRVYFAVLFFVRDGVGPVNIENVSKAFGLEDILSSFKKQLSSSIQLHLGGRSTYCFRIF